jgi:hypothetical protein
MLDPSRNVDPTFRTTIVITDRGITRTGLAVRDEGQVLLLVDSDGEERRISHGEIDERTTLPLSPIPTAIEKALNAEDFIDLTGFHSPVGTACCSQGREPLETEKTRSPSERYKFDRLGAWFILGVFPGMTHGEDGYDSTAGVRARGVLAGCDTAAGK